jgi:osmotically-inducible protein OsmY
MKTIAGIFLEREQAQQAIEELYATGFDEDRVRVIASPTSAAEMARQAGWGFSETQIRDYEVGVAQGQVLLTVEARNDDESAQAERILQAWDAEHVVQTEGRRKGL